MSNRTKGHGSTECQHAKSRYGSTLVELLIVITLTMMIMGVVSAFLRIMFQSSASARKDANTQTSIARLSDAFRADVHRAEQAIIQEGSLQLKTASGSTIHYHGNNGGVKRDETKTNGQLLQRDGFWLPAAWDVRWDVRTAPQRQLVSLTIKPTEAQRRVDTSAFCPLTIRAALAGPDIKPSDSFRLDNTDENSVE